MDSILIDMIVLAFAAFAIATGLRVIVHDWIDPAFLLMKPLSCDFCMAFWSTPLPAVLLLWDKPVGASLVTAVSAIGLTLFLLKKKALMEPPPPELQWPTSHDS